MITREQERFAKNVLICAYVLTIPLSFVRLGAPWWFYLHSYLRTKFSPRRPRPGLRDSFYINLRQKAVHQ
jgi:hypothetical protein